MATGDPVRLAVVHHFYLFLFWFCLHLWQQHQQKYQGGVVCFHFHCQWIKWFLLFLPSGPREGCDRHRPPPPSEPHRHLQWGWSAETLEALRCWTELRLDVLTQQLLPSLWTVFFIYFLFLSLGNPFRSLWTCWWSPHHTIYIFTHSWILETNSSLGFWSVCTEEP